jgi:lipoate-protein ligase A
VPWIKAESKVTGGKLVRIKVDCSDGTIRNIMIEGDFFVHPEEGLIDLESSLIGSRPGDGKENMIRLRRAIEKGSLRLIGFDETVIVDLLEGLDCSEIDGA